MRITPHTSEQENIEDGLPNTFIQKENETERAIRWALGRKCLDKLGDDIDGRRLDGDIGGRLGLRARQLLVKLDPVGVARAAMPVPAALLELVVSEQDTAVSTDEP